MTPTEIEAVESALGERILSWRNLAGGYSHETCALDLASGPAVVRLGGDSPAIEAAVMRRGREQVPVPRVRIVHESTDADVRSFMVIDHVDGHPLNEVLDAGEEPAAELYALGGEVAGVASRIGSINIASAPGFFADAELCVPPERAWSEQLPEIATSCM